ncbi:hypothetical protein Tco_0618236 [Tanacetum coccineum]
MGSISGFDIANAILGPTFADLYNEDAVAICCLGILQLVLLGYESKRKVPEWLLRIANEVSIGTIYPWVHYVWPTLYFSLRNANVRRWGPLYVDPPANENDHTRYSLMGYTWAFKTWILESFRVTAIRYYDHFNWYPRVAAWNKKKGRFLAEMVISFFDGNIPVARLTPDDYEARSDWWISSRAYFDGFIDQVERVPFDLSRQNMYEIPSDIYRQFAEQQIELKKNKRDVDEIREEMLKLREEMNARPVRQENTAPIIVGQHYGFSDFSQFQSNQGGMSSFKQPNFQTPMRSQPGSSDWQRQMPEQSANHYWQPSSQPGSYYSFGQVPSHMRRPNLQTNIETQHDVADTVDQGDNEAENNVTFLGSHFTGNILFYENVDPAKVRRLHYEDIMQFLNNPYQIYLDCYMKGYIVPVSFWQELAPLLCRPDMQRLPYDTPNGWLAGEHMNSWVETLRLLSQPNKTSCKMPRQQMATSSSLYKSANVGPRIAFAMSKPEIDCPSKTDGNTRRLKGRCARASYSSQLASMNATFATSIALEISWVVVLRNHDQESALQREGAMKYIVGMKHTMKAELSRRAQVVVVSLEKGPRGDWGAVKSIKTWK